MMHEAEDKPWDQLIDSPFTSSAEDLLRYYFFNFYCNTGTFPPFSALHTRVHETEWFMRDGHACPGTDHLRSIYEKCKEEIA